MDSERSRRMHHQDHYVRSSNSRGDGGGRLPLARGIAPTAVPSLSTGQGYYTVESLQGATVVPPPQIAPPPPRLMPPREPYPDERAYGPRYFDSRGGPLVPMGRKFHHISPPPRGGGPGFMMPHPPPPFMGDPRMPGFHPGLRDPIPGRQRAWGPPPDFDRKRMDVGRDQNRPRQRPKAKKQAQKKPVSGAKIPGSAAAVTKSPVQKEDPAEGGPGWCCVCQINCYSAETLEKHLAGKRHKRQLENEEEGEKVNSGGEETIKADQEDQALTKVENVGMVTEGTANVEAAAEKVTDAGVSEADEMMVDAGVREAAEMMVDAGVRKAAETTVDARRVSEAVEMSIAAGVSETAVLTVDAEVIETAVVTVSETDVKKDDLGVGKAAEIAVNTVVTEVTVNAVVTEAADAGATKAVEKADTVARKPAEKSVLVEGNEVPKEKSEQVGAANIPLDGTPLVGKKRGAQEGGGTVASSKKPRKPASSPGAAQNTAPEGAKVKSEAFREVCELCQVTCTSKAMLENHLKTKKHAANLKKSTGSPSVRGKKDQSKGSAEGEEESSERIKEDLTGVEGGAKESSDITDLANGKAEQSAEIH